MQLRDLYNTFKNDEYFSYSIGAVLAGFVCYGFAVESILFFLHYTTNTFACWIILATFFLIAFYILRVGRLSTDLSQTTYIIGLSILLIAISLVICGYFIDYSYDGQSYHGEAIRLIHEGWNPTYAYFRDTDFVVTWVNHFAKSSWIFGGFLYTLTGKFEYAKSANIILCFASFFIIYPLFKKWFVSSLYAIPLTILLALNPIWLNLYLSNMLDSQVASCMYILLALLVYYLKSEESKRSKILLMIYLIVAYSINLKFTVVGYYVVLGFGLAAYLLIKRSFRSEWKVLAHFTFAFVVAFFLFGYNTYVRNTMEYQHPFYPLKGEYSKYSDQKSSSSVIQDALDYRDGNVISNFIKSNFAKTTYIKAHFEHLEYKLPFMVSKYELERFAFAGVLVGGFGVWYSGVMLISLGLLLLFFLQKTTIAATNEKTVIFLFLFFIMISIFINPLNYFARYIPQYYLIPFIAAYVTFTYLHRPIALYLLIFTMTVNSVLIGGYTFYNFIATSKAKSQLIDLQRKRRTILVNWGNQVGRRASFQDYGIPYCEVDSFAKGIVPDTLFRSEVTFTYATNN